MVSAENEIIAISFLLAVERNAITSIALLVSAENEITAISNLLAVERNVIAGIAFSLETNTARGIYESERDSDAVTISLYCKSRALFSRDAHLSNIN